MTMTTTQIADTDAASPTRWRLDAARSTAEFRVPTYWGLVSVKGRFGAIAGELDLSPGAEPAIDLRIEATSLDTGNRKRDEHLRSAAFFDVERYEIVRFSAREATLDSGGDTLHAKGELHAAGKAVELELDATIDRGGGELALEAAAQLDQRELGMTTSPMGMIRPRTRLLVRARMVPLDAKARSGHFGSVGRDGKA